MFTCNSCGAELAEGARFCDGCGAAIPPAEESVAESGLCPNCGTQNAPGSRFCDSCGADLGGGAALPNRVVPMLHPKPGIQSPVPRVRDIADRHDLGVAGEKLLISFNAVLDPKSCIGGQLDIGRRTGGYQHGVAMKLLLGSTHANGQRIGHEHFGNLHLAAQVNSMRLVKVGQILRKRWPKNVDQRKLGRFKDRHLDSAGPCRSSNFQSDPARAHDDESTSSAQCRSQTARVVNGSQAAGPVRARQVEDPCSRASR